MESLLCSVAQKVAKLKISCEEAILEAEVIETEVASIQKVADTCVQLMQESTSENAQQVFLNTSQALQEPENSLTLVAARSLAAMSRPWESKALVIYHVTQEN